MQFVERRTSGFAVACEKNAIRSAGFDIGNGEEAAIEATHRFGITNVPDSTADKCMCFLAEFRPSNHAVFPRLGAYIIRRPIMASVQPSVGRSMAFAIVMYLVQLGILLLVVFHDFSSKDPAIVVSLLIMMYGMNTAQIAGESMVSGMHFLTLVRLLAPPGNDGHADHDVAELTRKESPFTLAHSMFGLLVAVIGATRLIYTLFS